MCLESDAKESRREANAIPPSTFRGADVDFNINYFK